MPLWFLLNDGVRDALIPTTESFATADIGEAPPVVFVVFDEFPLNSLLDENYEVDAGRYPNFSALAAHSYWFRNTTTVSSETMWAVPAIVSGIYPFERGAVPTRRYYPNNLFTVLSERYEMTVFGRFLQLCPAARCAHDLAVPEESVGTLVADSTVVLAHILLPEPLTRPLARSHRSISDGGQSCIAGLKACATKTTRPAIACPVAGERWRVLIGTV